MCTIYELFKELKQDLKKGFLLDVFSVNILKNQLVVNGDTIYKPNKVIVKDNFYKLTVTLNDNDDIIGVTISY